MLKAAKFRPFHLWTHPRWSCGRCSDSNWLWHLCRRRGEGRDHCWAFGVPCCLRRPFCFIAWRNLQGAGVELGVGMAVQRQRIWFVYTSMCQCMYIIIIYNYIYIILYNIYSIIIYIIYTRHITIIIWGMRSWDGDRTRMEWYVWKDLWMVPDGYGGRVGRRVPQVCRLSWSLAWAMAAPLVQPVHGHVLCPEGLWGRHGMGLVLVFCACRVALE